MIEKEKKVLSKLESLESVNIHLAEFEHVMDYKTLEGGHIDPNVLSAGMFPWLLRNILNTLYKEREVKAMSLDLPEGIKFNLIQLFKESFPSLKMPECEQLAIESYRGYFNMFGDTSHIDQLFETIKNTLEKMKEKRDKFSSKYKNDSKFAKTVFEIPTLWSALLPEVWAKHRVSLVEELYLNVSRNTNISGFKVPLLSGVCDFIENAMTNLDIPKAGVYASFKVEFEGDFGYAIKYLTEKSFPKVEVRVLNDLHHNSSLFAVVPLASLSALLGKEKRNTLYRLLIHGKYKVKGGLNTVELEDRKYPRIEYSPKWKHKAKFMLSKSIVDELDGIYSVKELLTKSFDQYAYLWEHSNQKTFDLRNKSERVMYLSNAINAKGSFFKIYESMEELHNLGIEYPKTTFVSENEKVQETDLGKEVVLKEGGLCSTGGKGVLRLPTVDITPELLAQYNSPILQEYVDNLMLEIDGLPYYGHIRMISVLNSDGVPFHLGYGLKATSGFNSSSYRTVALFFDSSGEFRFGMKDMSKKIPLFSLKGENIKFKYKSLNHAFEKVRYNWLVGMYYLNEYCNSKMIKKRFNSLVKDRILAESFVIE
ncbi:hypothetical protein HYV12_03160 [Candidatus Dojkabacteria bacterium]|nr:hypothetical protein [Candidatus Dojkabacteria bacterium]